MDDKWLESLIVSRSEGDGRFSRKKRNLDQDEVDAEDQSLHDNFQKEATFELPVELTENGVKLLKEANVSVSCAIPPSRIHGRWSGRLEGHSNLIGGASSGATVGGASNASSGSFMLDYMATSWSQVSLGMIRGHELYHPLVSVGGTLLSRQHGATVGVAFYHNPSFLHPTLLEHAMYSISFRKAIPDSRWKLSAELSRTQQFSVSATNSKVQCLMAWNLRRPEVVQVGVEARPKISEHRRVHIYWNWKLLGRGAGAGGCWQLGASLVQSLHSQVASVGIGLQHVSTRGLEWVFSWNRGDACVRIPIVISRSLRVSNVGEALYLSMVSYFIQETLADLWGWKMHSSEESANTRAMLQDQEQTVSIERAKKDAELQRQIMERQAQRKTIEEEENNGLVIRKATYQVDGGDALDVTVQLKFWVTRSSLSLPAISKQYLLGFYNVAAVLDKASKDHTDLTPSEYKFSALWIKVWNDLWDATPQSPLKHSFGTESSPPTSTKGPIPTLTVHYEFKGERHLLTIQDHEALKLPNPLATTLLPDEAN
jgi:hypothetical protein